MHSLTRFGSGGYLEIYQAGDIVEGVCDGRRRACIEIDALANGTQPKPGSAPARPLRVVDDDDDAFEAAPAKSDAKPVPKVVSVDPAAFFGAGGAAKKPVRV